MDKNPTTPLYNETLKNETFFDKKDYKKYKNNKTIPCL